MAQMLNRREFLANGTIAAAVSVGVAMPAFADEPARIDEELWDGEYDVIVIGAGGAGLTAAITVADEGSGATCLLIEKGEVPSGNTPYALGYVLYADEKGPVRNYLGQLIGGATPDDVIDAFVDGLAENRSWISGLGADEADMFFVEPNTTYAGEYPEFEDAASVGMFGFTGANGGAAHIQNFLFDTAMSRSIDYMPSTAMEELVQDGQTGEITGVIAGGKRYRAVKGVVMCCGGFESDPEMINTYLGVSGAVALAGIGNTGDGHRACAKVGADMWHMYGGALFWMGCRDLENTTFLSHVWNFDNKRWGIVVGKNGRRFYMDWDGCAITPADTGSDITLNVGYRHGITQLGGNWSHLSLPDIGWYIFDADGLANGAVPTDLTEDPVADGFALTAGSIEELASMIEVPADELGATVDAWNASCDAGKDLAFYRPSESLNKVATAPFFAIRCTPSVLNTDGGPRRDAQGRILDPFGKPIPHLYSAGEFGSVWGHLYQGAGNLGECLAFGRIAARSALQGL